MSRPATEESSALSPEIIASEPTLTAVTWSPGSAASLIALAMVLSLLAAAIASASRGRGMDSGLEALVLGGALLLAYAGQMGLVWLMAHGLGAGFTSAVGLRRVERMGRWLALAAGAALAAWLFSLAYAAVVGWSGIRLPGQGLRVLSLLPDGPVGRVLTVLIIVFVAPFAEEIVFRGVLLSALRARWGTLIGIGGSAVVFSALHASVYGLLPLLVLSVVLGVLFVRSRSLWVSMLAHSAFNAFGVAALLLSQSRGLV